MKLLCAPEREDERDESKIEMKQNGSSEGGQRRVPTVISLGVITLLTIPSFSSTSR